MNQPTNFLDSSGSYRQDFHQRLTEVIAIAAGYSPSEARDIAKANQATDSGERDPIAGGVAARKDFHFTSVQRRLELFDSAMASRSPADIGPFLHATQDSYSHRGYGPEIGHALAGTAPDITANDPQKALKAAVATFNSLVLIQGGSGLVPFATIQEQVLKYLSLPENDPLRSGILADLHRRLMAEYARAQARGAFSGSGFCDASNTCH